MSRQYCPSCGCESVPASGNKSSKILIIGEMPGFVELEKGRPFCLQDETPILMADLSWKELGNITVGDELLAPDEFPDTGGGISGYRPRKLRVSIVTQVHKAHLECLKMETDKGNIICTPDHLLLTNRYGKWIWDKAENINTYGKSHKSKIAFFCTPWDKDYSWEAGYLSGFYDGEGSISINHGGSHSGLLLACSQKQGSTLEQAKTFISKCGYDFRSNGETRAGIQPNGVMSYGTVEHLAIRGGTPEIFRFLGSIRPNRLIQNFKTKISSRPIFMKVQLASLMSKPYKIGREDVTDISTTTRTFIANGFVVHNCGPAGGVLRSELSKVGLDMMRFRVMNLWLHEPSKNDDCFDVGYDMVLEEAKGKDAILMVGSDVVDTFTDYSVSKISGLPLDKSDHPFSAKVVMAIVNPAIVFHPNRGIGEVRFGIQQFGKMLEMEGIEE